MANGAPSPHDEQVGRHLAAAQAQQHAQRELARVLDATLANPVCARRAFVNKCVVDDDEPTLLVALPHGERWEIPLNRAGAKRVIDGLLGCFPGLDGSADPSGLEVVGGR